MADTRNNLLEKAIQTGIDSAVKRIRTFMPAVIQSFDPVNQLVDVQVVQQYFLNNEWINLPLMSEVPIRYPHSSGFCITWPLNVGDHVGLICSDRSIDNWLTNGDIGPTNDFRKHSISDAFAFPMMYPQSSKIEDFDSENLQIRKLDGSASITITTNGEIHLNGDGDSIIAFTPMDTLWQYFVGLYNGHTHPVSGSTAAATPNQIIFPYTDLATTEVEDIKVP